MRLHEVDERLFDGVHEVVDVTHPEVTLARHLRMPAQVRYRRAGTAEPEGDLDEGVLVLALTGPNPPAHTDPDALAPLLHRLRPGARLLLLAGWAVADLPVHRLLDPLGAASCQVIAATPLDRVAIRGVHATLLVERVDTVVTPRPHLTGSARATDAGQSPVPLLRMANEYVLTDLVTRPARRRLAELADRVAELDRQLAERDARLAETERELAGCRSRLAAVESSPALRMGRLLLAGPRQVGQGAGAGLRRVLGRQRTPR
ncbi:hypothetical protein AB0D32_07610 [Micromonospora sp. NPDC048170]|uniref:hypothetical protein n=1 Tax=Micromonospora sp. NPDC048170 TaxID=3154819 RepID=UPI00340B5AE0